MSFPLSVVICSHNPRKEYLIRVLEALRNQTLPHDCWELLLIDNASLEPLSNIFDLSWHVRGHHIREEQLGLTAARLRGISEATGSILVFVDDDNILDPDYLEVSLRLSEEWPILGAWGGQIRAEFERPPSAWTRQYWTWLAIREFTRDQWSNLVNQYSTTPYGAGLCLRRVVAEQYRTLVTTDPRRLGLGRKGGSLSSCEDIDLAYLACDMGLCTGLFTKLRLLHIMPAERLEEKYLLRLVHDSTRSLSLLQAIRGSKPAVLGRSHRIFQKYIRWRLDPRSRRFHDAKQSGEAAALREIESWRSDGGSAT
jgi:hypothetical protein